MTPPAKTEAGILKGEQKKHHWCDRPRKHPYKSIGRPDGSGIAVHRLRAEQALGRPLKRNEIVHHADGSNSEFAPLVICQNEKYHKLLHARMRVKAAGGNPNTDYVCKTCKQVKPRTEFTTNRHHALGVDGRCKPCSAEWQRQYRTSDKYKGYIRPQRKAS